MDTEDNTPSEQQEPFWDSAQAQEGTTPAQSEPQTVSVPQGQIMGNLAQQPQTHFSATVNNPAQYSSASSIASGYDMTEQKAGMNWKQFAIGFFAPIVIMMLLTTLSEVANEDWDNRWDDVHRMEMITMSSENGTFTHTFDEEFTDNGRFVANWCYSMGPYEGYDYYCNHPDFKIIEDGYDGQTVVGEYNEQNKTIWFTTESHSIDEIEFEFEFKDRELEMELDESGGGGDMVDTFFCLMPLAGVVAIVISFARGNKSLGYGLIASVSIPIVLGGLMLTLLLMFGF